MRKPTFRDSLRRRRVPVTRLPSNNEPVEKVFGKYRGIVVDNADPKRRGRVRLKVPSLMGDEITGWAMPCMPYGGKSSQGFFMVPEVEASVWVEFEEGDLSLPIWTGTFWQQRDQVPDMAANIPPNARLLQTAAGHVLLFDDENGHEQVRLLHPRGAELVIDEGGGISLKDASGGVLKLDADASEICLEDANGNTLVMNSAGTRVEDANGSTIEMDSAGLAVEASKVVIKGGAIHLGDENGEPIIKGSSFLSLFASHIHTSAPVVGGPTSPPLPQDEVSTLSTTVKVI